MIAASLVNLVFMCSFFQGMVYYKIRAYLDVIWSDAHNAEPLLGAWIVLQVFRHAGHIETSFGHKLAGYQVD